MEESVPQAGTVHPVNKTTNDLVNGTINKARKTFIQAKNMAKAINFSTRFFSLSHPYLFKKLAFCSTMKKKRVFLDYLF